MPDTQHTQLHRQRHYLRGFVRFLVYLLAFFLAAIAYWVSSNFGQASLEQVLYHMQFGMAGLVDTDVGIIRSFIQWCVLLPMSLAFTLVLVEYSIALFLVYDSRHWLARPAKLFHLHSLKIFYWFISHRAPFYLLVISFIYFSIQFSLSAFLRNQFGEDYFGKHYVNPATVKVTAQQPKNLMLIYVESLENTYNRKNLFGKDLLTRLDAIPGTSFNRFRQVPGTHWTIAGLTATQCGVPLKSVSLYGGNDQGENIQAFLPNAICLGDILHDAGYYNVYMGGDALAFSGKGKFFQDHHFDEVYGREELKRGLVHQDMNYWGLYDDDLFVMVKAKLKELHAKRQPFNLTITTIDTHGPNGHISEYCNRQGVKEFKGIVECTADQVADFVAYMRKSGYLKDTNVLILGDHLAMWNPLHKEIDRVKERHIYNRFISSEPITKNREAILHFDMFPTILEFAGFKVEKGKLGLGYSAISKDGEQPSKTIYEDMDKSLLNKSETYLDLWRAK